MERLSTEAEVARNWLNVEPTLLERHRHKGNGPPCVRATPRVIRYSPTAVQRWLEERMREGYRNVTDSQAATPIGDRLT